MYVTYTFEMHVFNLHIGCTLNVNNRYASDVDDNIINATTLDLADLGTFYWCMLPHSTGRCSF